MLKDLNMKFYEYITGNRFIDICEKYNVGFAKIDFLPRDFDRHLNTKIMVTHNGDLPLTSNLFQYKPPNIKKWFAQNKIVDDTLVTGIPIGLENTILRVNRTSLLGRLSSQVPNALEKMKLIHKLHLDGSKKDKLVYMNFSCNTNPAERHKVRGMFQNESWVTKQSSRSFLDYYKDIQRHKFVISPPGNGVDCHRTWESLYLRTIPIVKKSVAMNEFSDLPLLIIDDWNLLTKEFLEEKYEEISEKQYNLSKLSISYWDKIIKNVNENS